MSEKSERSRWSVKERNFERRVDMYSIPGVDQVIYPDEWVKNNKKYYFNSNISNNIIYSFKNLYNILKNMILKIFKKKEITTYEKFKNVWK